MQRLPGGRQTIYTTNQLTYQVESEEPATVKSYVNDLAVTTTRNQCLTTKRVPKRDRDLASIAVKVKKTRIYLYNV